MNLTHMSYQESGHIAVGIPEISLLHALTKPEWVPIPINQDIITQTALRQHIYEWGLYRDEDGVERRRDHDRSLEKIIINNRLCGYRVRLLSDNDSIVVYNIEKNDKNNPDINLDEIFAGNATCRIWSAAITADSRKSAQEKLERVTLHVNPIAKSLYKNYSSDELPVAA